MATTTKPSTTTTDTKKILADRIKFLTDLSKNGFDPEKKREEIKENEAQIDELQKTNLGIKGELAAYTATGLPAPADEDALTADETEEKIKAVMPNFLSGADGKQIAKAISDYRITTDTVSALYWTKDQTVLRKEGQGTTTKYFVATADDLERINAAKDVETKRNEAIKAKRAEKKK